LCPKFISHGGLTKIGEVHFLNSLPFSFSIHILHTPSFFTSSCLLSAVNRNRYLNRTLRGFELFITQTRNCEWDPDNIPDFASSLLPSVAGWFRDQRGSSYRRHLGRSAGSRLVWLSEQHTLWSPARYQQSTIIANVVDVDKRYSW